MPQPLVSILISCFNGERFVDECLACATSQSYSNVEVIFVDDGSTDGSLDVARTWQSAGVKVLSQENAGQAAALNRAFANSRGAFVQYLDIDDLLHRDKIRVQVERLIDAPAGSIATGKWGRFRETPADAVFRWEPVWKDLDPIEWMTTGGTMPDNGWLLPRAIVEAVGPWPVHLRWAIGFDYHFFVRAVLASSACLYCEGAVSYYRSTPGSHSSARTLRSREETLQLVLECGEALLRKEDSPRTRAAFADSLMIFIYSAYPKSPDLVSRAEQRVAALGGSRRPFARGGGGPLTVACSRFVGWKAAKRARLIAGAVLWR